MLAAGLRIGVAREAGLYMIKAGGAVLNKEGEVIEEDLCADALLESLRHVIEKLQDETLTKGKTAIVIDTREWHLTTLPYFRHFRGHFLGHENYVFIWTDK